MKTSALIKRLEKLIKDYGDLEFGTEICKGEKTVTYDCDLEEYSVGCEYIGTKHYIVLTVDCGKR